MHALCVDRAGVCSLPVTAILLAVAMSRDVCCSHKERQQFGGDLGSFQISQEKLARMLANIQARHQLPEKATVA